MSFAGGGEGEPRGGGGIARFRIRSASREDAPGVDGALPPGGRPGDRCACGPPADEIPPVHGLGFLTASSHAYARAGENRGLDPLRAGTHLDSRFLSLPLALYATSRARWTDVTGCERLPDLDGGR